MSQKMSNTVVSDIKEAEVLLLRIKALIKANGLVYMNRRGKNAQTLLTLGITAAMQRQIIDDLTATDYCSGPDRDIDYPGKEVAVFGYDFRGAELYIKFSFGANGVAVVCISFHESDRPMRYPF